MKTPWKRTLGIVLSSCLFIITPGAYATLGESLGEMTIGTDAPDDPGLVQTKTAAGQDADPQRPDTQSADIPDFPSADIPDSSSTDIPVETLKAGTEDKSTQTDILVAESEKTQGDTLALSAADDKQDQADTTGDDEDENEKININTASEDELVASLKGIGPTKAREIIKYRDQHGPFEKIDHIKKVKGIGPSTFGKIKSQLAI